MSSHSVPRWAGIGLRLPHLAEVAATWPSAGWLEIHPENFLANPHAAELLIEIARHYPISVHTVGVSVGSACGLDRAHLARVRDLIDRLDPVLVSGHLAWSTHAGEYLNDLLPLPYDAETLAIVTAHVQEVQDVLGRPYLVENPSCYLGFRGSTMTETEFLGELVLRTGCGLLCDVSNVYVSAHNMQYDATAYMATLPADAVAELHLGGFTLEEDEATPGGHVLVDTHDTVIADPSWRLYAQALRRFPLAPTLIEWDADLPALSTLLAEAARADVIAADVRAEVPLVIS
jgi:uncharacterized protein (UPF0276 family)